MKKVLFTLLFLGFYSLASALTLTGTVTRVLDGDTIMVGVDKVRFRYIDAPESKQKSGPMCTVYLKSLIEGKQVTVIYTSRDLYKRIIGTVMLDKTNINKMMVSEGYSWSYKGYDTKAFRALQLSARTSLIGMWKENEGEGSCEPWNFRKKLCTE